LKTIILLTLFLNLVPKAYSTIPVVDFKNFSKALQTWYNLPNSYSASTIYKGSNLADSYSIYFDEFISRKSSKWVVAKSMNYNGSYPWFKSRSIVQTGQAPYVEKLLDVRLYYWIYNKLDHDQRLLVVQSRNSVSTYYQRSNKASLALANSFLEEIEKDLYQTTPYRGSVLEFNSGMMSFWKGIDDLDVNWDSFIFNQSEKKRMVKTIDGFLNGYGSSDWKKYGLPSNRGVLLHGPPGTGKSFVAKILASNVMQSRYKNKVTYIHVQARHLLYSSLVRSLYNAARKFTPSVIFIEDVDLIAGTDRTDRADVKNELMQQLSGVEELKGVITIATTNLAERIDPALKRSKRLGFHHLVGLPSFDARKQLFSLFTKKHITGSLNLEKLSSITEGRTGAFIKDVVALSVEKSIANGKYDRGLKKVNISQGGLEESVSLKKKFKN
jgi:hypothetical protein